MTAKRTSQILLAIVCRLVEDGLEPEDALRVASSIPQSRIEWLRHTDNMNCFIDDTISAHAYLQRASKLIKFDPIEMLCHSVHIARTSDVLSNLSEPEIIG